MPVRSFRIRYAACSRSSWLCTRSPSRDHLLSNFSKSDLMSNTFNSLSSNPNITQSTDIPIMPSLSSCLRMVLTFFILFLIRTTDALILRDQNLYMYSSEQTHKAQTLTKTFLATAGKHSLKTSDLEGLREILRFHEYRYSILNEPLISDFEYDT